MKIPILMMTSLFLFCRSITSYLRISFRHVADMERLQGDVPAFQLQTVPQFLGVSQHQKHRVSMLGVSQHQKHRVSILSVSQHQKH